MEVTAFGGVKDYHRVSYGEFLQLLFGCKVQKIPINSGFSCPNRDGSLGVGGCTYCNNSSFSPVYTVGGEDIVVQIEKGKKFFSRKYGHGLKYVAYFQSFTSTYGLLTTVKRNFEDALEVDDIVGLVVSTRPDCLQPKVVEMLAEINRSKPILIELGVESAHDRTLMAVNRCHTWNDSVKAIKQVHAAGMKVCVHLILGLPGETENDFLETINAVSALPVDVVKFHQLQVLKGTKLARQIATGELSVRQWTAQEYAMICARLLCHLRGDIVVERFVSQSPKHLLISPWWNLKKSRN